MSGSNKCQYYPNICDLALSTKPLSKSKKTSCYTFNQGSATSSCRKILVWSANLNITQLLYFFFPFQKSKKTFKKTSEQKQAHRNLEKKSGFWETKF